MEYKSPWIELEEALIGEDPVGVLKSWLETGKLQKDYPMLYVLTLTPEDQIYHKGAKSVWEHTLLDLSQAVKKGAGLRVRLAILFHDTGKAVTFVDRGGGRVTAIMHEKISPVIAEVQLKKIKCPASLIKEVFRLIEFHMRPHFLVTDEMTDASHRDALFVEFNGGIKPILDNNSLCVSLYNDLILHAQCDTDRPSNDYEGLKIIE